ncbi:hypothetical protein [Pseudonocardia sp. TMWB2A]
MRDASSGQAGRASNKGESCGGNHKNPAFSLNFYALTLLLIL